MKAVYPGTFDPITNGHLDILKRALELFQELIILVASHREKIPIFTLEERTKLVKKSVSRFKGVKVESFEGLLVDYTKKNNIDVVIRGLRAISDFDYEFQMAQINRKLHSGLEIIFIMPGEEYFFLSSSLVKEIASRKGDVSKFVPEPVAKALKKVYSL